MKQRDYSEISINVPKPLLSDLERFLKDYNFKSIEELIIFLLTEAMVLYRENGAEYRSSADDEKRKKTLKDLGYI